ncbi:hypothetical protein TTHERM_00013630 (macronuclear) [Tetrahymena thermophila SB210]|uniref:Uncharacterized protein n=1 Tax=Tetrahymena thermophila (strain SB210) TaxID=312017 RepID=Q22RM5_TETTS|nr:hypothetical protein TTHERM_00013630 [Tetrahymena thermophila SB210]EAR88097.2 hypothetical protein TTHERM_00013630 [Tetrahymena thermophila SB210]|eukprot:XP_001008342.2 hypothetical protein TTHERM_00013630 [Tetrahymena thermophila SB210]
MNQQANKINYEQYLEQQYEFLITELQTDYSKLNQQLTAEKRICTNLTDQIENLKSQLSQQQEKTNNLKKQSEDQIKTLNEQIININNLLVLEKEKASNMKKQSEDQKKTLTEQISKTNELLKLEKEKVSNLIKQSEDQKKTLTEQITKADNLLILEKEKVSNLTKQSEDQKKTFTDQISKANELLMLEKVKVSNLTKQSEDQIIALNEQITQVNKLLVLEQEKVVNMTKEFKDKKTNLKQTLQTTQQELEVVKSEKNTILEKNKKTEEQQVHLINQLKHLNEELKKQLQEMTQNLKEKNEKLNLADKQLLNYNEEILFLKQKQTKIINALKKKQQSYQHLQQNYNDEQSQNKQLQSTLDDFLRKQNEFKQEIIELQEQIQGITEQKQLLQNQLQVVSGERQSIQQFQITSYDQQINLTHLFMDKPKIQDFFSFQYEESMQDITVSLLSYQKGSSYILSQILEKNITKKKNNDNNLFIHNHKVNEYLSSRFLNTKKMGLPITCYKKNENNNSQQLTKNKYFDEQEKKNQQMIQNFLIDLVSNISDVQILVVNEVTEQEQNLIARLKSDFLQNKYVKDDKQLIVIHLLTEYNEEQLEEYSQKIQGFFKLTEKQQQNYKYFKDQDYKSISHFIIGNEYLQEKEKYFTFPINKIKSIIFEEMIIDGYSIYDRIQEFLNKYYTFYVQISHKQNFTKSKQQGQQCSQQNDINQKIFNSKYNDQHNICERDQMKLFIQSENDLILNDELYDFLEVKNYNYKLQKKTITEVNYNLNLSNDEQQLQVKIEIPAKVQQVEIELSVNTNKLLIFAQKSIPNSSKCQQIMYQLQNHIFEYYELFKEKHFENKDGVYIITLKRLEKYKQSKLAQLCRNIESFYQLNQFDFNC